MRRWPSASVVAASRSVGLGETYHNVYPPSHIVFYSLCQLSCLVLGNADYHNELPHNSGSATNVGACRIYYAAHDGGGNRRMARSRACSRTMWNLSTLCCVTAATASDASFVWFYIGPVTCVIRFFFPYVL